MSETERRITSGGFSLRDSLTQSLIASVHGHVLTEDRYLKIETGIEHRFETAAEDVHRMLYNSMSPTTDLLRYFPDSLYFDRRVLSPTWEPDREGAEILDEASDADTRGMFCFFVEFKYSATPRCSDLKGVPSEFVGQIEREAWLTYRRLTSRNPEVGIYLDGARSNIALIYVASYAPDRIYACWEGDIDPIYVRPDIARPGERSIDTAGSGTPWVNFDIRTLKPLAKFLHEDLHWNSDEAEHSASMCMYDLFPDTIPS